MCRILMLFHMVFPVGRTLRIDRFRWADGPFASPPGICLGDRRVPTGLGVQDIT